MKITLTWLEAMDRLTEHIQMTDNLTVIGPPVCRNDGYGYFEALPEIIEFEVKRVERTDNGLPY